MLMLLCVLTKICMPTRAQNAETKAAGDTALKSRNAHLSMRTMHGEDQAPLIW